MYGGPAWINALVSCRIEHLDALIDAMRVDPPDLFVMTWYANVHWGMTVDALSEFHQAHYIPMLVGDLDAVGSVFDNLPVAVFIRRQTLAEARIPEENWRTRMPPCWRSGL